MENDVRQRNHQKNRRRERAQRMQAQRDSKLKDGDSGEDESPAREKPPRPPARRKKSREPLGEEDIIDGFAIMAFRTYEDLEAAVKSVTSPRTNSLSTKPRLPLAALAGDPARNHPPNNVNSHGITLLQDAGTSDDSGRASERLTGSSVAPRDPDSSRDRLSDASSRCSSGKGYICDSEGDDDKASPDNSRNASPRYHDASMEDVSDGSLFRVTGAGAGGGSKSELVARGGSGGALALSRAPVGGSASPAPAPLPQPAPSPAPAALPPPALPPPVFRADTPLRSNGAHIPALDGHAATQIPTRPLTADTPERPASNKLQPGARAAADSPTPAPPAPSPHFPYQAHATLPDYRHTNHETRTVPSSPAAAAPLNLHAQLAAQPRATPATAAQHHPSLPNHAPHSQAHPVMPGHDVRNVAVTAATLPAATPFPNHVASIANHINGIPHSVAPHTAPSSAPNSLPTQTLAGRPPSPTAPHSRPYPTPTIGSSHINSSLSSSIHNHSIPYQSHASLQKHSVQSVYGSRPPHLAPFSVSNHLTTNHVPSSNHMPLSNHISASNHIPTSHPNHMPSSNHIPSSTASVPMSPHPGLPVNSHSANHLPTSNSSPLATSTPNHIGPTPMSVSTSTPPSFTSSIKHPGLSLPPVHAPPVNSMEPPSSGAPTIVTTSSASGHPTPAPLTTDARVPMTSDARVPVIPDSRVPITSDSRVPLTTEARVPMTPDSRVPIATEARVPAGEVPPRSEGAPVSAGYPPPAFASAPYPPLYAPYATTLQHSPYLPASAASPRNSADTRTNLSASPLVAPKTPKGVRPHTPGSTGGAAPAISHSHHVYSPRGHSPNRERDSFSSNISTLSRASGSTPVSSSPKPPPTSAAAVVTSVASGTLPTIPLAVSLAQTISAPLTGPLAAPLAVPLAAPLVAPLATPLAVPLTTPLAAPTPTPAAPGAPLFPHSLAPVPTVPSISSSAKPPAHWGQTRPSAADRPAFPAGSLFGAPLAPPNPNPFSAESLFQTSPGADLLRRELDNRFLAAAGGFSSVRTEMHHHQHQHTHVHHPPAAPPPAAPPPAPHHSHHPHHHAPQPPPPPPLHHAAPHHPHQYHPAQHHATLFKDVSKMSLYRSGLGLGYPYSSSLLHPAAPYVAPAPLSAYAPKPVVSAASDPATKPVPRPVAKTGKWNAMHVRIAWEIYNHQQKEKASGGGGGGGLSSSLDKDKLRAFPPPPAAAPPPPQPYRSPYDLPPHYLPPHPHLGMSPFARYGASGFHGAPPPFGLSPYARELALSSSLHGVHHPPSLAALHEAWRAGGAAQPRAPVPPQPTAAQVEARRDHEERARRERDERERERRDRDERERRKQRERELERVRQRSPLRNGVPEPPKEERKEAPRPPPALPPYPPAAWDPYRSYDPLHHMRFPPLVEAAIRAEEDRAKMLSAYAHHQQLKAAPLLHRAPLPPLAHATLPPLPLPHGHAPLDMLKKEEPR